MTYSGMENKEGLGEPIPVVRTNPRLAEGLNQLPVEEMLPTLRSIARVTGHFANHVFVYSLPEDIRTLAGLLTTEVPEGIAVAEDESVCMAATRETTLHEASRAMADDLALACGDCALRASCDFAVS